MDNWYSLSYLYFSTVGTLVTLLVGILVSLSTGNYLKLVLLYLRLYQFLLYLFYSYLCYFTMILLTTSLIISSVLLMGNLKA